MTILKTWFWFIINYLRAYHYFFYWISNWIILEYFFTRDWPSNDFFLKSSIWLVSMVSSLIGKTSLFFLIFIRVIMGQSLFEVDNLIFTIFFFLINLIYFFVNFFQISHFIHYFLIIGYYILLFLLFWIKFCF